MKACVAIYGPEAGAAVMDLVEAATRGPCPCTRDLPCPLLDGDGCNPLVFAVPD